MRDPFILEVRIMIQLYEKTSQKYNTYTNTTVCISFCKIQDNKKYNRKYFITHLYSIDMVKTISYYYTNNKKYYKE